MLDLIVSVPDHCLSFYFDNGGCSCKAFVHVLTIAAAVATVSVNGCSCNALC